MSKESFKILIPPNSGGYRLINRGISGETYIEERP